MSKRRSHAIREGHTVTRHDKIHAIRIAHRCNRNRRTERTGHSSVRRPVTYVFLPRRATGSSVGVSLSGACSLEHAHEHHNSQPRL